MKNNVKSENKYIFVNKPITQEQLNKFTKNLLKVLSSSVSRQINNTDSTVNKM